VLTPLNTINETALVPLDGAARAAHFQAAYEDMRENARATSTRRVYEVHWKHFTGFCRRERLSALPAAWQTVVAYALDCAGQCSMSTLTARLAAIAQRHADTENNPAAHPQVKEVLKGIRRKHGRAPKAKEPALTEDIRAMVDRQPETPAGLRNKALLLVGYASACRRSEVVAFDVEDLKFTREGITLAIRKSKTDQEAQGQMIAVQYLQGSPYFPVLALRAWLTAAGIKSGPVFRRISKSGRVIHHSVITKKGRGLSPRLSAESVALIVKEAAQAIGKDPEIFAGHSLRSGFATQVAKNGGQVADIMRQTRHKSVDTAMIHPHRPTVRPQPKHDAGAIRCPSPSLSSKAVSGSSAAKRFYWMPIWPTCIRSPPAI
jgi:integrase